MTVSVDDVGEGFLTTDSLMGGVGLPPAVAARAPPPPA